jgi:hypothetical protein
MILTIASRILHLPASLPKMKGTSATEDLWEI